jgi:glycosyltransferase involved in cell wall biosynthesis
MKVAILGTRGIPNYYGGFEQCAEYLALGLIEKGVEVTVYNSHNHPYKESIWNGVKIVHCYDPESNLGTVGQFIYDLNCIINVRKANCDIIIQLGYTSSSIWGWLLPKNTVVTTNMDGLEWKRTKYSPLVKKFLRYAEKLGIKFSDHLISDSIGIQEYLRTKYGASSIYIAYGATVFKESNLTILDKYHLNINDYDMLVARLEPENSIDVILKGVSLSGSKRVFLVIGNHETPYGIYLKEKYQEIATIKFIGGIYNINDLNNLRYYSHLYFHGHTVGGTNPSLLEAMASNALICANDNSFNRYILNEDAFYFKNEHDVANYIMNVQYIEYEHFLESNRKKIENTYDWQIIVNQYYEHLLNIVGVYNRNF